MDPLKRVAQWIIDKLFAQMAQLDESPHNQNRIHDGQEWLEQSHSLPTNQSGQEYP